jgi:GNAT superfamily N-acetyltransferase
LRGDIIFEISGVKKEELRDVYNLIIEILPSIKSLGHKYSFEFWQDQLIKEPTLLLKAVFEDRLIGFAFGWIDNGSVTFAHLGVKEEFLSKGLGKKLVLSFEQSVKNLGYDTISLGSVEGKESFYEKLGYRGLMLVQSEKHSVELLISLVKDHEIISTGYYEEKIAQVFVSTSYRQYASFKENTTMSVIMMYNKELT